jgi:hypothetical protein
VYYLGGVWADVLGWALVLGGMVAFAGLVTLIDRRNTNRFRIPEMPPRLDGGHEWERVIRRATKELARSPRVEELQADATMTIESAEYAYNRLVVDCAKHCAMPTASTIEPTPELPRKPEEPPAEERPPLAA